MISHRRDHPVGISAEALALAWARVERAPSGATVVTGQEISPRGFNGRLWDVEAERTLALAVVLRPELSTERADVLWLAAGLAARDSAVAVGGVASWTRWPDSVIDDAGQEVGMVKVQTQLGPAGVRAAVATIRIDLHTAGLSPRARAELTDVVHEQLMVQVAAAESDAEDLARDYGARGDLVGRRVKVELLPTGEARGTVHGFEPDGALRLGSGGDVHDRIPVHAVRLLRPVDRS